MFRMYLFVKVVVVLGQDVGHKCLVIEPENMIKHSQSF